MQQTDQEYVNVYTAGMILLNGFYLKWANKQDKTDETVNTIRRNIIEKVKFLNNKKQKM